MKKWIITTAVISASGFQKWLVEAETENEALGKFNTGDVEFLAEEIEVTSIGDPVIKEECS